MPSFDGFLALPPRAPKPRENGLTHVIDKGMNLRDIEGLFDTAGDYVDIVKLGWGTSYVTRNLEKKIALYRSFDTPVVCGGTLFEAVYLRDRIDQYKSWLKEQRFSCVEISDGAIEIPRERKLELIRTSPATSACSRRSAPRTKPSSTPPTNGSTGCRKSLRRAPGR